MGDAPGLLRKDLIVVTGKGGVGKTTVATAIGMVAARRGLRTIVAEVAARDDVSRALGTDPDGPETEDRLGEQLHHISIDPQTALEEYLSERLPAGFLADVLARSRLFSYFTAATPGLRELLTVGKVWELAQAARRTPGGRPYDLVVLDAPATGHGVAILEAPRTFAEVARVGPIHRQGRTIDAMLSDPDRTGVVAVARPEEMPVNETLALQDALRERMGLPLSLVVANGVLPDRYTADEVTTLEQHRSHPAVAVALAARATARAQRSQLDRLRRGIDAPTVRLPFVFAPALGHEALGELAGRLERAL
jgi:anion-transporting  ArsA/GET3 family ATPase